MASGKGKKHDKYLGTEGRVFLSGNQALVRLAFEQRRRDEAAGLNTGGYISGYRGSPLGHLDQEFGGVKPLLEERNIHFKPGVNEDLAVAAVWGSQEVEFFGSKVDGVFGLWYSKGPGIDRSGDALRHANLWGTSKHGGVVMAVGDDPMSRSSSTQQQSELTLASFSIPVFSAANVQEVYDYGLLGWQLSRYAGVWVAIKAVSDIYESWYPVDTDPARNTALIPADHVIPPVGVHTRWPDWSTDQDLRLLTARLPAVKAFARANKLNRVTHGARRARLGIVTSGKSWADTLEALRDLGIDAARMEELGLAVFKAGLIWPLEPTALQEFAQGLEEILVIEECRPMLEPQVKDILYGVGQPRPVVLGKHGPDGEEWMNSHGELTPVSIARTLVKWLGPARQTEQMQRWLAALDATEARVAKPRDNVVRTPYFCSGCPHNTSTKVPEGSNQLLGIGCHTLTMFMERGAITFPHMGGEGVNWVGAAPFAKKDHMFANVGDGTWYHSGSMAIRQAVAAGVNITYKILYNDAVAMTGGQAVDGPISVNRVLRELEGEGVSRIALVSSDLSKHPDVPQVPGLTLHHRDELDAVQRQLREHKGVSVIVYEQPCATELRRRRGRKEAPDPARRVFINERVCEGCGDCSVQSNCLSVQPLETEFGRKRVIDQSACNKDFSCIKGFCPSFVTIEGGKLRKGKGVEVGDELFAALPEPATASLDKVYGLLVTGIGGTGVVTIANLVGAAAQREGKFTHALDLTGMAQKFGAVYCHLQVATKLDDLHASRLSDGKADLLLGADVVVAASNDSLTRLAPDRSRAIVNSHETVTGAFTRDINFHIPVTAMERAITEACGDGRANFLDSTELAREITGDTIGANMMLLGYACQRGWLPVRAASLETAIEENGVAVPYNLKVFRLGRLLAVAPEKVLALRAHANGAVEAKAQTADEVIARREADLVAYQDAAYARRYREQVEAVRAAERRAAPGQDALTLAAARGLYKLMAYKDEYEVARLYTDGTFEKAIREQFEGDFKLNFHLAPPLLSKAPTPGGRPPKRAFGPLMLQGFRLLARFRKLRGTPLDVFGYNAERREERRLIEEYAQDLRAIAAGLTADNHGRAIELARVVDEIRGYGPVKAGNLKKVRPAWERLRATWKTRRQEELMAA
ncbi:MAG: indolepyruvate ferredoxin oxidoreductase family protein [Steroidobacteraceae bacterium]